MRLAVTLLVALYFVALVAVAANVSAQKDAAGKEPAKQDAPAPRKADKPAQPERTSSDRLQEDMRKLWSDHIFWERNYIIASVANSADLTSITTRLYKNQVDIGNAMSGYYGEQAGGEITALLKEHINLTIEFINAVKAKNEALKDEITQKRQKNIEQIADYLSTANPNWSKDALLELLKKHLTTSGKQLPARIEKRWEDDVKAFDEAYDHILVLSDALTDGVVKQFPERFEER